jgi:GT2 family glycosyltransferase
MKVLLLTPVLDQPQFLPDSIASVAAQTLDRAHYEHRILDGGSGPETMEALAAQRDHYPGLRIESTPDAGQADALRRGFADTDADILGWLNADDMLGGSALETAVELFEADPGVDVVYGDALFIDERGRCIGGYPTAPFDKQLLPSFCYLSQPSVFFRREAYEHVGGLDACLEYALDYDLWLRLLAAGATFRHVPRVLSATRLHAASKTAAGGDAFTREVRTVQERHFPGQEPAGRRLWERYRTLRVQRPRDSRAGALAHALVAKIVSLDSPLACMRWALRIAALQVRARRVAAPYLGSTWTGWKRRR